MMFPDHFLKEEEVVVSYCRAVYEASGNNVSATARALDIAEGSVRARLGKPRRGRRHMTPLAEDERRLLYQTRGDRLPLVPVGSPGGVEGTWACLADSNLSRVYSVHIKGCTSLEMSHLCFKGEKPRVKVYEADDSERIFEFGEHLDKPVVVTATPAGKGTAICTTVPLSLFREGEK